MTTLTPDTIGDYETVDNRLNTAVTQVEREAWNRISGRMGRIRNQVRYSLRRFGFSEAGNSAHQLYKQHPQQFQRGGRRAQWLRESLDERTMKKRWRRGWLSRTFRWSLNENEEREWRKAFSANGVSEANVQVALNLSRAFPTQASKVLRKDSGEAEKEVAKAKAEKELLVLIEELNSITLEPQFNNFQEINSQLGKIHQDIDTVENPTSGSTPTLNKSEVGKRMQTKYSNWSNDDDQRTKALHGLEEEENRLMKPWGYYQKLRSLIERINERGKAVAGKTETGKDAFTALDVFFNPAGFLMVQLNNSMDPKVWAERCKQALRLKTPEEYSSLIKTKEQAIKDAKEGKNIRTGREAVLAIYQEYFEQKQGLSPDQARKAAHELYGRNSIGKQEVQLQKHMVRESREVLHDNKQRWWQEEARDIQEYFTGSEEDFVSHIAESPEIGMYPAGTRRLWVLYRKSGRGPAWGKLGYPKLLTAYFAIRDAQRQGHVRNSRYVRNQLDEVSKLLMTYHVKNLVRDFDASPLAEDQRKDLDQSVDETTRVRDEIKLFLSGDVPPTYAGDVTGAIEYAKSQTAWKRRAVGRGIKRTGNWAMGKGSAYNPLTWPGKTVRGVIGLGKGGGNKVRAGFGKAWDYLFHQKGKII